MLKTSKAKTHSWEYIVRACFENCGKFLAAHGANAQVKDKKLTSEAAKIYKEFVPCEEDRKLICKYISDCLNKVPSKLEDRLLVPAQFIANSYKSWCKTTTVIDSYKVGYFTQTYFPQLAAVNYVKEKLNVESIFEKIPEELDEFTEVKRKFCYVFFVDLDTDKSREEKIYLLDDKEKPADVLERFMKDFNGIYYEFGLDVSEVCTESIRIRKEFL